MQVPIEIFLGCIVMSIALAIFGFLRQPQIPAMLVFGGMFILTISVATDEHIMGKIPITSVSSGNTVTYDFIDNIQPFDPTVKMLFALMGAIFMLCGALMMGRGA